MTQIKKLARLAMDSLENMPCGSIGEKGSTQEELDEAAGDGMPYDDDAKYHDAMYHQSQQAWLYLKKIVSILN